MKNNELKVLNLNVNKKWFDMIASGDKKEEYRELKGYWLPRLVKERSDNGKHVYRTYDEVHFRNGYGKNSPECRVKWLRTTVDFGNEDWGAKEGVQYFVIVLGDIIETKNIKEHE